MGDLTIELVPGYKISRIIRGTWQWSKGHNPSSAQEGEFQREIAECVAHGITTFDTADIYGTERALGEAVRNVLRENSQSRVRIHTKCVPNLQDLARLSLREIRRMVFRSRKRLGREVLDLVQFHWWDYNICGFEMAMEGLNRLRALEGTVYHLGLTNCNATHVETVLRRGIPILSNQVQLSLIDRRPLTRLAPLCETNSMWLLCYGTIAGGLLSDTWLGKPHPKVPPNRSIQKYLPMVERYGGWEIFQQLLRALRQIADRHNTDIASIATAWVLAQPRVAAAIVGARNVPGYAAAHARIPYIVLTAQDLAVIDELPKPPDLGGVFDIERNPGSLEFQMMWKNKQ